MSIIYLTPIVGEVMFEVNGADWEFAGDTDLTSTHKRMPLRTTETECPFFQYSELQNEQVRAR